MKLRSDYIKSIKKISVIELISLRGNGVEFEDPVHEITQYWSENGTLLAENVKKEKTICAECSGEEDYPGQHVHVILPDNSCNSEAVDILREVEKQLNAIEPYEWHGERIKVNCYGDGIGGDCEHSLYKNPCEGHKLKKRIEEFNKKMRGDGISG